VADKSTVSRSGDVTTDDLLKSYIDNISSSSSSSSYDKKSRLGRRKCPKGTTRAHNTVNNKNSEKKVTE